MQCGLFGVFVLHPTLALSPPYFGQVRVATVTGSSEPVTTEETRKTPMTAMAAMTTMVWTTSSTTQVRLFLRHSITTQHCQEMAPLVCC